MLTRDQLAAIRTRLNYARNHTDDTLQMCQDILSLLTEVDRLAALEAAIRKALPFGYLTLDYGAHHPNDIHCHLLTMDDDGNEFDYEADGKDETEAINNTLNKLMEQGEAHVD